ncbi:hypothetical protein QQZ08_007227 [Neonectria magnoliae]|uniref:Integral membrane protein n=1 Tax=Neonectria magnoliae TaxID=2732573 RepID=A0ABR1HYY4_9HYPO
MALNLNLPRNAGTLILMLGFLPLIAAHGGGHNDGQMNGYETEHHGHDKPDDDSQYPSTYFSHTEHVGMIYAHIALMTLAWAFVLPVGTLYNAQTPDLYSSNAHHKLGWIVTWIVTAQVVISTVGWLSRTVAHAANNSSCDSQAFLPVPNDTPHGGRYRMGHDHLSSNTYRLSEDSGQGTDPNTESLRSNSISSIDGVDEVPLESPQKEYEDDADDLESMSLFRFSRMNTFGRYTTKVVTSRIWKYMDLGNRAIDRIILPLGSVAFASGIVTFGRFFEGFGIYNGLAHWVKGGVFFWLGLFTLGRWSGSFAEVGWAWNVRPKRAEQKWRPSAEFVESALIFFYGSTNIFLEHLSGWGGKWTSRDMEHISITVLFIGGGLCGMLIESTRVRDLLNTTVDNLETKHPYSDEEAEQFDPPDTYEFSLNPFPALVILLLGIMMGSHTQSTMISSMVHRQWGNLLLGASFARGLTYVLMFLKPPKSILPYRPPTELLVSFGLISGGIIFMASAEDTVKGMIHYDLDAMFMYTVTMGLVGLLMAWEVIVIAIKGWAVRSERCRTSHRAA